MSSSGRAAARRPISRLRIRSARSAWATRFCSCWLFARGEFSGPRCRVILIGYWGAFALYPLPGPAFDFNAVGVPSDWPHHPSGFAAHWDKNSNLAWAFDTWFLNLFSRKQPFTHNGGGYATLSFIPTLATMILGLLAGGVLKRSWPGLGEDRSGSVRPVASAWRPAGAWESWASAPWSNESGRQAGCSLAAVGASCFLAGFYAVLDAMGVRFWAFPLRVIGMNSIAAYCMAGLWEGFIAQNLTIHLGKEPFSSSADLMSRCCMERPCSWSSG